MSSNVYLTKIQKYPVSYSNNTEITSILHKSNVFDNLRLKQLSICISTGPSKKYQVPLQSRQEGKIETTCLTATSYRGLSQTVVAPAAALHLQTLLLYLCATFPTFCASCHSSEQSVKTSASESLTLGICKTFSSILTSGTNHTLKKKLNKTSTVPIIWKNP